MGKIVIARPEGENISGLYHRILLMPVPAILKYEPGLDNFVYFEDFEINTGFNPTLYALEGIVGSGNAPVSFEANQAGEKQNVQLSLRVPAHYPILTARIRRMMQIRYFVVFFRDLNTEQDNKRWRVFGTMENPMELKVSQRTSPMDTTFTVSGDVLNVPWFDINENPEELFGTI